MAGTALTSPPLSARGSGSALPAALLCILPTSPGAPAAVSEGLGARTFGVLLFPGHQLKNNLGTCVFFCCCLREHVAIPTPPPEAMKISRCVQVSGPLLETSARDRSPLPAKNKQGPGARGKSRADGGTVASGSRGSKFWAVGPVNFPGKEGFPPGGS